MSDGDIDRPGAFPGPQANANDLVAFGQACVCSPFLIRWAVCTYKEGLGTAYGRQTRQCTQVARQAKPAGMGEAVSVHQNKVGRGAQTLTKLLNLCVMQDSVF